MDMEITFPGGLRVDARFQGHLMQTDQPPPEGEGSAPAPFDLFLASLGTCAGIFVLSFCRSRGIPAEDIRLVQRMERDPDSGMLSSVRVEIVLPEGFPERYAPALVRAAGQCSVKRHLERPPSMEVVTVCE